MSARRGHRHDRWRAVLALCAMVLAGTVAAAMVSPRDRLRDLASDDPTVAATAWRALADLAPQDMDAIAGELRRALATVDRSAEQAAESRSREIGMARRVRRAAATFLGRGPATGETLRTLGDALRDPDADVARSAATSLGKLGGTDARAIAWLEPVFPRNATSVYPPEVRAAAAEALGGMLGPMSDLLVRALGDADEHVREVAATAFAERGVRPDESLAIPALIGRLRPPDPGIGVRQSAVRALGSLRPPPPGVLEVLIEATRDPEIGRFAVVALQGIGLANGDVRRALADVLAPRTAADRGARLAATEAFGAAGDTAVLLGVLRDDRDEVVRRGAVAALGRTRGREVDAARTALLGVLADPRDGGPGLRRDAVLAAGSLAPPHGDETLRTLIGRVTDAREDPGVREAAVTALPDVVARTGAGDAPAAAAKAAAHAGGQALAGVAGILRSAPEGPLRDAMATSVESIADDLAARKAVGALPQLTAALDAFGTPSADSRAATPVANAQRSRANLEAQRSLAARTLLRERLVQFPWNVLVLYGVVVLVLLALYWLRPYAILRLANAVDQVERLIPEKLGTLQKLLPPIVGMVAVVGLLRHRPRVLDAWVAHHAATARRRFEENPTVRERAIHVPVPVKVDDEAVAEFAGRDLGRKLAAQRTCFLIWGEGGSGKTSLACRIARWGMADDLAERPCDHLMLPLLLQRDLDDGETLIDALAGKVRDLIEASDDLPAPFLRALLVHRRLLVIVDHLSEMKESTRRQIQPGTRDFAPAALLVTSRLRETLGDVLRTEIQPLGVSGNRLSSFMEAYLARRGKRELFDDAGFFELCKRISALVGERTATALLVKLAADQAVAAKERRAEGALPDTIPDLMLRYVNDLNATVAEGRLDDHDVHRIAGTLAWECLRPTYRVGPARCEAVLKSLGGEHAEPDLAYLEKRLGLVETLQPAQDAVRFLLDPLAEYLAARHLVTTLRADGEAWRRLVEDLERQPGGIDPMRGFVMALHDACKAYGAGFEVPSWVTVEIARRLAGEPSPVPAEVSSFDGRAAA